MSKMQIPIKPKTAATPADTKALRRLKTSLGLIIAAFAFLLYAQSIQFNYTLDDHFVLTDNAVIKKGFSSIPAIFKTDYLFGSNEGKYSGPVYRPASLILFAIEWQMFPDSPHLYHFINVLLYAITCWILFLLLCKLFENIPFSFEKWSGMSLLFPFVCSLLYAAHPIHTEVVNSLKSDDEILCFLFGILSIYFAIKSILNKFNLYLFLSAICFFFSSISKETGITFLVIIPLTVFVFTDSSRRKIAVISLTILAVSAISLLIRAEVLQSISLNTSDTNLYNSLAGAPNYLSRQSTAFYVLLKYILLLIFPHPLTYDYNFSQIKIQTLSDLPAIAGLLVNFSLGVYAILNLRKKSIIAYGILFYFITIAPTSNVFLLNGSAMAERFLYTPSLGFCIVLAYFIIKFTKTKSVENQFQNLPQMISINSTMFIFLSPLLGLYSVKTFARSMIWKDNYTIYSNDIETSDNSATAHGNLAISILVDAYPNEKNETAKQNLLDRSISEFKKSLEIFPENKKMYEGLGLVYFEKKDYENSISIYHSMLRNGMSLESDDIAELSFDFYNLGVKFNEQGQYDKSISLFDSAIKYAPQNEKTYLAKGMALGQKGYDSLSNEMFLKAISINPKSKTAYKDLGVNYRFKNHNKIALDYFFKALAIDSTDSECLNYIGITYKNIGDTLKAKEYFEKANWMSSGQQK